MTSIWITDRLPTEADADPDGNVRNYSCGYVQWDRIELGQTWTHSFYWKPKESTDRFTEWLKQEAEPKLSGIPFHVRNAVRQLLESAWNNGATLTPQESSPRRITSITRTVHHYGHTLDAIADDGTAWCMIAGDEGGWKKLPELPAKDGQ